ncbi:MAG: S-adenosylmethionine decarboxylase [Armatimonadota bacterium]
MIALKYWLASLRGCAVCPDDADTLLWMVRETLRDAGFSPLAECRATDPRRGSEYEGASVVEVFVPLAESHCVAHTFPALRWVLVELSTCGRYSEAEAALVRLANYFQPKAVEVHQHTFTPQEGGGV